MTAPMVVPVPTPMNMRPSWAIVKPRFSMKIIGNASNTGIYHFSQVRYETQRKGNISAYVQIADHILWLNKWWPWPRWARVLACEMDEILFGWWPPRSTNLVSRVPHTSPYFQPGHLWSVFSFFSIKWPAHMSPGGRWSRLLCILQRTSSLPKIPISKRLNYRRC